MIPLYALAGAAAYRLRGTARGKWVGRVLCALLVSLPVLTQGLGVVIEVGPVSVTLGAALATVAYLLTACVSFTTVGLPHDPSGRVWLQQGLTGLAFTVPTALVLALLLGPGNLCSVLLVLAGLLKAACYLLPEGWDGNRFFWRESAFGACWGAAMGVGL